MRDKGYILQTSLFNTLEFGFFSKKFCFGFNVFMIHSQLEKTGEKKLFFSLETDIK